MLRIVVLPYGFVVVGNVEYDGTQIIIHNPAIVRNWGTEEVGLGYLADNGPQPKTILDKGSKPIRTERLTVVFMWDCDESKWTKN